MKFRFTILLAVAVMLPATTVTAQTSGTVTGRYATHTISQDVQEMPDGSSVVLSHYYQIGFALDGEHPIDNMSTSCVGLIKVDASGSATSGSGSCFGTDTDGDGTSFWWRLTDTGSDACDDICGVWGYYAGDGKFTGLEGTGTWQRTTLFSDGSTGNWQGSYTLP